MTNITREWDQFYASHASKYSIDADWWRIWPWKRHLFRWVFGELSGKVVIDIGCGTAARVAAIAPVQKYHYRYLGINSSLAALRGARANLSPGAFVCASLDSLCLPPASADIILCLGLLMYFKDSERLLHALVDLLKPGGFLLLHEAVSRKSWGQPFTESAVAYPSQHGVSHHEPSRCLEGRGTIVHKNLAGSPWRKLMISALDARCFAGLRPLAAWVDSLWCAALDSVASPLGASEVQIVFQKAVLADERATAHAENRARTGRSYELSRSLP